MSFMLEGAQLPVLRTRHRVWQRGRYLCCALVSADLKKLVTVHFSETCFKKILLALMKLFWYISESVMAIFLIC